jgi:hypothetical protein
MVLVAPFSTTGMITPFESVANVGNWDILVDDIGDYNSLCDDKQTIFG